LSDEYPSGRAEQLREEVGLRKAKHRWCGAGQATADLCPGFYPGAVILQEKCGIFSCRGRRIKMQQAIEQKILSRIYGNGRGWTFSQADFADLAARSTIDSTLHRREHEGVIRRVIRGIYDYPRHSTALEGPTSPSIDQVAHALARKFAWRIQPEGATAQNLLGLSTQVPARVVYLSDGPDRSYTVGRTKLTFEHTALKEAGFKLPESRLTVQALKAFGEGRITPKVIAQIRRQFDPALRQRILLDTKTATGWVYAAIQEIAKEGANG
jgi:hypothetical protein